MTTREFLNDVVSLCALFTDQPADCVNIENVSTKATELLAALDEFTRSAMKQELPMEPEEETPVKPVVSYGDLTKSSYNIRRKKASRVSFLSGSFGLLIVTVALFVFLWNFWVKDLFSPAERIELPDFIGSRYDDVVRDADPVYNFIITDVYTNCHRERRAFVSCMA